MGPRGAVNYRLPGFRNLSIRAAAIGVYHARPVLELSVCPKVLLGTLPNEAFEYAREPLGVVDGIAARGNAEAQATIRDRVAQIVDRFPVPGLPETVVVAGHATA